MVVGSKQWANLVDSGFDVVDFALTCEAEPRRKPVSCTENKGGDVCAVQAVGEIRALTKKELTFVEAMAKIFIPEPRSRCVILQWKPKPDLEVKHALEDGAAAERIKIAAGAERDRYALLQKLYALQREEL